MLLPGGVNPLQERPPVVRAVAFRPAKDAQQRGNAHGFVIFPALLVPIQAGGIPALNDAIAFRVFHAGVFPPRLLDCLPDCLKATARVQVGEIGLAPSMEGHTASRAPTDAAAFLQPLPLDSTPCRPACASRSHCPRTG